MSYFSVSNSPERARMTTSRLTPEKTNARVAVGEGGEKGLYAMDVLTVDGLREECVEVERSFGRRVHAAYLQPSKLRVSEAHIQDEVDEQQKLEVDELRGRVRSLIRSGCWNCGAAERGFQYCEATEWRRFCFRCGRPDVPVARKTVGWAVRKREGLAQV